MVVLFGVLKYSCRVVNIIIDFDTLFQTKTIEKPTWNKVFVVTQMKESRFLKQNLNMNIVLSFLLCTRNVGFVGFKDCLEPNTFAP